MYPDGTCPVGARRRFLVLRRGAFRIRAVCWARREDGEMDQKKVGGLLKALRRENNLTQEKLAERLGVSARTVSRW